MNANKPTKRKIMTPYRRGKADAVAGRFNCPYRGNPAAISNWRKGVREILSWDSPGVKRSDYMAAVYLFSLTLR